MRRMQRSLLHVVDDMTRRGCFSEGPADPSENEDLHVWIEGDNDEDCERASEAPHPTAVQRTTCNMQVQHTTCNFERDTERSARCFLHCGERQRLRDADSFLRLFALLMFQLIRKLLRVGSTENDEHMRNQVTARLQRALPGRLMQRFEHTRARWRRTCSADVQLDCHTPTYLPRALRPLCGMPLGPRREPLCHRPTRGTARHGPARQVP